MPDKQIHQVQTIALTDEQRELLTPFFTAADALARGFSAGVEAAKRELLKQVLEKKRGNDGE